MVAGTWSEWLLARLDNRMRHASFGIMAGGGWEAVGADVRRSYERMERLRRYVRGRILRTGFGS
jgi:hypothetical protein